jgi:hypothetical protein
MRNGKKNVTIKDSLQAWISLTNETNYSGGKKRIFVLKLLFYDTSTNKNNENAFIQSEQLYYVALMEFFSRLFNLFLK